MSGYAKYAASIGKQEQQGKRPGIWVGYSRFEVPSFITEYGGQAEAHVLLLLYRRAAGTSYNSMTAADLTFTVRQDTLALNTGLTTRSVRNALVQLGKDKHIVRTRRKRSNKTYLASRVTLLDGDGQPLQTSPQHYGVCRENKVKPFITMPKVCLEALHGMTPSQKGVYIAAHALASREKRESVYVAKEEWQILSGLAENAFNRGVKQCKSKGLLSYSSGVLTINDPQTRKPTQRWQHNRERIEHVNPEWAFDLNDVTAEEWQYVVESLLGRKLETDSSGWTLRTACPFCAYKEKFHVNFSKAAYRCHSCDAKGRLGWLVGLVKNVNMDAAKEYIKERIAELQRMRIEV
jgi:hypothetical protein